LLCVCLCFVLFPQVSACSDGGDDSPDGGSTDAASVDLARETGSGSCASWTDWMVSAGGGGLCRFTCGGRELSCQAGITPSTPTQCSCFNPNSELGVISPLPCGFSSSVPKDAEACKYSFDNFQCCAP
jgi:hypothetical protein